MRYRVERTDFGMYTVVNNRTNQVQSCWTNEIEAKDTASRLNRM